MTENTGKALDGYISISATNVKNTSCTFFIRKASGNKVSAYDVTVSDFKQVTQLVVMLQASGISADDLFLPKIICMEEGLQNPNHYYIQQRMKAKTTTLYNSPVMGCGGIIFPCSEGSGYHVQEDYFYPEILEYGTDKLITEPHKLDNAVAAADAVDAAEPLDDAHGIPMDIVIHEIIAVLEVLPFGNAVRCNQEIDICTVGKPERRTVFRDGRETRQDFIEIAADILARRLAAARARDERRVDATHRFHEWREQNELAVKPPLVLSKPEVQQQKACEVPQALVQKRRMYVHGLPAGEREPHAGEGGRLAAEGLAVDEVAPAADALADEQTGRGCSRPRPP